MLTEAHKIESPATGVHLDIPAEVYHSWRLASATYLNTMHERSAAHAKQEMTCPTPPTPQMKRGEAIHLALLQPNLFCQRYSIMPDWDNGRKAAREARAEAIAKFGEDNLLTEADMLGIRRIVDAVGNHHAANRLIGRATHIEASVVWDDRKTGVRCKARSDMVCADCGILVDLKTTTDASPAAFSRTIHSYGYHRQLAHYLAGWAAAGVALEQAVIVAIEKEPPYAVAAYTIDHEALELGEQQRQRTLARWAECEKTGEWPGYGEDITDIYLPAWAAKDQ